MSVSRDKLYEEIWAEPMTTVAQRYDLSSNYLARICERLKIPRPHRGYWQQRAFGAKVARDPLPPAETGEEIEWNQPRRFEASRRPAASRIAGRYGPPPSTSDRRRYTSSPSANLPVSGPTSTQTYSPIRFNNRP